jgi:hypothetical protein
VVPEVLVEVEVEQVDLWRFLQVIQEHPEEVLVDMEVVVVEQVAVMHLPVA